MLLFTVTCIIGKRGAFCIKYNKVQLRKFIKVPKSSFVSVTSQTSTSFVNSLTRPMAAQHAISEVISPKTANLRNLLAATISAGPAHRAVIGVAELPPC